MRTAEIEIENKVDQLLEVLDKDIQHLEDNLSKLNELRGLVIKRDDVSLHKLLEGIQLESGDYKENDLKRRRLREELAAALDFSFEQMTLSRLETQLSGEKKTEVGRRKIELRTLAEKLKKEHLSTAMLLSDCARFNSVLLKSVLELGQGAAITYNPRGFAERHTNPAFVNLQF